MDKKQLTKDQKQTLMLLGLLAVVGIVVLKMFMVDPMLKRLSAAKETLKNLETKVRDAEGITKNATRNAKLFRDLTEELIKVNDESMPLPNNEFAWAFRQVHNAGWKIGWSNVDVKESGRSIPDARFVSQLAEGPYFQSYNADVRASTGFFTIAELLRQIQHSNPFATTGRLVMRSTENPENHEVDIRLQWPVWSQPEDLKKQRELAGL
jgi:hypothetical protein